MFDRLTGARTSPFADPEKALALLGSTVLVLVIHVVLSAPTPGARVEGVATLGVAVLVAGGVTLVAHRRLLMMATFAALGSLVGLLALLSASGFKGQAALALMAYWNALLPPFGLVVNPNAVAYLVLPAGVSAFALLSRPALPLPVRAFWTLVTLLVLGEVLVSGSRASLVGLVAGSTTVAVIRARAARRVVAATLCLTLALAVAGAILGTGDDAMRSRLELWAAALQKGGMNGAGYGGFALTQAGSPIFVLLDGDTPLNAHSLYVQTLEDFGWDGVIALGVLSAISVREAIRLLGAADEKSPTTLADRHLATGILGCVVALAVVGVFESVLSTGFRHGEAVRTVVSPFPLTILAAPLGLRR